MSLPAAVAGNGDPEEEYPFDLIHKIYIDFPWEETFEDEEKYLKDDNEH